MYTGGYNRNIPDVNTQIRVGLRGVIICNTEINTVFNSSTFN